MKAEYTRLPEIPWPDPNFDANRARVPLEELVKYQDQFVAWSWDGSHIVAGAATEPELFTRLEEAGIDFQRVVLSCVGLP